MSEALGLLSETLDLRRALDGAAGRGQIPAMPELSRRHLRLVVSTDERDAPPKDAVQRAQRLMREDVAAPWTVSALARKVAVSRPVLAQKFRARTGTSPMRWLTDLRMQEAAALLSSSDGSLAQIAHAVGYRSEFAFNRAFKRHHGVSPGRYRRGAQATFRAAA